MTTWIESKTEKTDHAMFGGAVIKYVTTYTSPRYPGVSKVESYLNGVSRRYSLNFHAEGGPAGGFRTLKDTLAWKSLNGR